MIAGLEDISDGELWIGDKLANDLRPQQRNISMVFQTYALFPHMNVRDNVGFGPKVRREPAGQIKGKVDRAASILNLFDYLDRLPRQLSGGQRQRVAMGRSIVRDPHVFLFDEPLSNLDAKLRVQMRTEIKALHGKLGTTIVYVTHDQIEAMTMADRIVVMNAARSSRRARRWNSTTGRATSSSPASWARRR
jgi:multiple sugar transport system ATP-binding protein